jgi:hypothetical protein
MTMCYEWRRVVTTTLPRRVMAAMAVIVDGSHMKSCTTFAATSP